MKTLYGTIIAAAALFVMTGCFEEKKTEAQQTPVVQNEVVEIPQDYSEEPVSIVQEVREKVTIPKPEMPKLPVPENLVSVLEESVIAITDIKDRELKVKIQEYLKQNGNELVRFISDKDQKEYTLDFRKLNNSSQQLIRYWQQYKDYVAKKAQLIADWEAKVAALENSMDGGDSGSASANKIFDSLSGIKFQ